MISDTVNDALRKITLAFVLLRRIFLGIDERPENALGMFFADMSKNFYKWF